MSSKDERESHRFQREMGRRFKVGTKYETRLEETLNG